MCTALRYRTVTIAVGNQTMASADPISGELATALAKIRSSGVH